MDDRINNPDTVFMIHDTYREGEIKLANDLAHALGRVPKFYDEGDYFAII
jgi:hypothetical protein